MCSWLVMFKINLGGMALWIQHVTKVQQIALRIPAENPVKSRRIAYVHSHHTWAKVDTFHRNFLHDDVSTRLPHQITESETFLLAVNMFSRHQRALLETKLASQNPVWCLQKKYYNQRQKSLRRQQIGCKQSPLYRHRTLRKRSSLRWTSCCCLNCRATQLFFLFYVYCCLHSMGSPGQAACTTKATARWASVVGRSR